ncbi:ficolin-2-like [Anopheles merus]|uniref:ficolin-2-like n=1 Tax=Anopheles merus TaxID=30066 RepID=UPI001BE3F55C|nr:ficolin-2-like [Anopheles merus]
MELRVGLCFLCVLLTPVLCDESCLRRSESFLSKLDAEIENMKKSIGEFSSFTKEVMWNAMQMEMRLRIMKMEMESFRQTAASGLTTVKATEPMTTSTAASAALAASAAAQASAIAGPSPGTSSNAVSSTSSCSLQQLLQDQFKGNVLIEIKAAPPVTEPLPQTAEKLTKTDQISSCSEAPKTGIYSLKLPSNVSTDVLCDAEYDKGGWVVIQYRFNGSEDFFRNWTDYESGFGTLDGEFWLGNEKIYQLTAEKPREIAFLMEDFENNKAVARYATFKLGNKAEMYSLKSLGSFSGTAGDSLSRNVGSKFTTRDMDNDTSGSNCALLYFGGWWYDNCHLSNLNGKYTKGPTTQYAISMCWNSFKGFHYSLKSSRIMVRF